MIVLLAILGGLFGWIYGGNALGLVGKHFGEQWKDRFDAIDKLLYYIAYGVAFSFLLPILNFYAFLVLAGSQWARRAISWGKYIGGLIHGRWSDEDGVAFIDQLIFSGGKSLSYFKLRCIAALAMIGALGGVALSGGLFIAFALTKSTAPLEILWLIPALSLKGVIFWAGIEVAGLIHGQHEDGRNDGWGYGETAFSIYLWAVAGWVLGASFLGW